MIYKQVVLVFKIKVKNRKLFFPLRQNYLRKINKVRKYFFLNDLNLKTRFA